MSRVWTGLAAAMAQTVSGEITGTVADPAGAVIVGAAVQLTSDLTQQVRVFTTDLRGGFLFTGVVPGGVAPGAVGSPAEL